MGGVRGGTGPGGGGGWGGGGGGRRGGGRGGGARGGGGGGAARAGPAAQGGPCGRAAPDVPGGAPGGSRRHARPGPLLGRPGGRRRRSNRPRRGINPRCTQRPEAAPDSFEGSPLFPRLARPGNRTLPGLDRPGPFSTKDSPIGDQLLSTGAERMTAEGATEASKPAPAAVGEAEAECNVCVAVHVRPLIDPEIEQGCSEIIGITSGRPQVTAGGRPSSNSKVNNDDSSPAPPPPRTRPCVLWPRSPPFHRESRRKPPAGVHLEAPVHLRPRLWRHQRVAPRGTVRQDGQTPGGGPVQGLQRDRPRLRPGERREDRAPRDPTLPPGPATPPAPRMAQRPPRG